MFYYIKILFAKINSFIHKALNPYRVKDTGVTWSHKKETIKHLSDTKKGVKPQSFKYTIEAPDGTVFETDNMRMFCRQYGLHQPNMVSVSNGKLQSYKGWTVTNKESIK